MQSTLAFVGLGGNIGDSRSVLSVALEHIQALEGVSELRASHFYQTTPVSSIPQTDYINAVCALQTLYTADELLVNLQAIERMLGKLPKEKDAPRILDLDILFYGSHWIDHPELQVPHPRWKERLFVLKPLSDLVSEVNVPVAPGQVVSMCLDELLENFNNLHQEQVTIVA